MRSPDKCYITLSESLATERNITYSSGNYKVLRVDIMFRMSSWKQVPKHSKCQCTPSTSTYMLMSTCWGTELGWVEAAEDLVSNNVLAKGIHKKIKHST